MATQLLLSLSIPDFLRDHHYDGIQFLLSGLANFSTSAVVYGQHRVSNDVAWWVHRYLLDYSVTCWVESFGIGRIQQQSSVKFSQGPAKTMMLSGDRRGVEK